jgi:hypothetical protein
MLVIYYSKHFHILLNFLQRNQLLHIYRPMTLLLLDQTFNIGLISDSHESHQMPISKTVPTS